MAGATPAEPVDEELSLDPQLQVYLSQVSRDSGCWGRFFPIPFERAAQRSWWDPTFDSDILEEQYKKSSSPYSQFKLRYAIWYMLSVFGSWFLYFLITGLIDNTNRNVDTANTIHQQPVNAGADLLALHHWPTSCILSGIAMTMLLIALLCTYSHWYRRHTLIFTCMVACILCAPALLMFIGGRIHQQEMFIQLPMRSNTPNTQLNLIAVPPIMEFSIWLQLLIVIYTLLPLKLYLSIGICTVYSVAFEVLWLSDTMTWTSISIYVIILHILLHLCSHLIGVHILIMTNVRLRNTFMQVGQSLLVRRQLECEKKLKESMIHSLMPPSVAQWLLAHDDWSSSHDGGSSYTKNRANSTASSSQDPEIINSLFRPFNMNHMENVSILFADIVGFTRMSSNKSADQLVDILNDLFQRFDLLCKFHNCEKIATLGDCYYCVSGCPEPRADHAQCCVEVGLSVIAAIRQFDAERNETVDMRVGIHAGTVLCGIVGTKRFKFDVWSNDVTLANRMEATGKAGMVHVSDTTAAFLGDTYAIEEGDPVCGLNTYFILCRLENCTPSSRHSSMQSDFSRSRRSQDSSCYSNGGVPLLISPSRSVSSAYASPRPRVLSYDESGHLIPITFSAVNRNPNMLSPADIPCIKPSMKANSMPSILDNSRSVHVLHQRHGVLNDSKSPLKTPTSTASSGKYSVAVWRNLSKIPRFLKRTEDEADQNAGTENKKEQTIIVVEDDNKRSALPGSEGLSVEASSQQKSDFDASDPTTKPDDVNLISDMKSYISQSRSDIGSLLGAMSVGTDITNRDVHEAHQYMSQFMRSRSYRSPRPTMLRPNRSQRRATDVCGPIVDSVLLPMLRGRSATLTLSGNMECDDNGSPSLSRHQMSLRQHGSRRSKTRRQRMLESYTAGNHQPLDSDNSRYLSLLDDQFGAMAQAQSRKDSGIRSDSRRSSIQPLESLLMGAATPPRLPSSEQALHHRVSGYYTSSQGSIASEGSLRKTNSRLSGGPRLLRAESKSVVMGSSCAIPLLNVADPHSGREAIGSMPLLFSGSSCIQNLRKQSDRQLIKCVQDNSRSQSSYFVRPPLRRFTLFFRNASMERDFRIHAIHYGSKTAGRNDDDAASTHSDTLANSKNTTYFDVAVSLLVFALLSLCLLLTCNWNENAAKMWPEFILWWTAQSTGLTILQLGLVVGVWYASSRMWWLLSFSRWNAIGSILAAIPAISVLLIKGSAHDCAHTSTSHMVLLISLLNFCNFTQLNSWIKNILATSIVLISSSWLRWTVIQNIVPWWFASVLTLVLVWLLNRDFEIGYRLSFHANYVANRDRINVLKLKNQADYLIYNIVPEHVAEQLKRNAKYSETFSCVGIIFASIVNFNEMYDESYMGGREFLRVLNELIGDFDELLDRPQFSTVDKIKTIGATFMAASGLNMAHRSRQKQNTASAGAQTLPADPHEHLFALIEFAMAMQKVVNDFNRDLLEFNLVLRVGYNFGEVTAAVIGNTKLYYDIWGDAVNIASRMDSTGVNGHIQVGAHCLPILSQRYEFAERGSIYVKGKDHMNVYLLKGRRLSGGTAYNMNADKRHINNCAAGTL